MIWFGSSAGVAVAGMMPEAKSAARSKYDLQVAIGGQMHLLDPLYQLSEPRLKMCLSPASEAKKKPGC